MGAKNYGALKKTVRVPQKLRPPKKSKESSKEWGPHKK